MTGSRSADLLEREAELEAISTALGEAHAGAGRLAVVRAPAGMGKSRLLAAAADEARERGFVVLSARGSELERDFPLGLARQLLDALMRSLTPAERDRAFLGPATLARSLLGMGDRESDASPGPSGAGLHALYSLVANVSDERALALIVDDAHWADDASLGFLEFLVRRLDDVAIALVVAFRAPTRAELGARFDAIGADSGDRLVPAPLSEAAVESVIRVRLGQAPAPEFTAACRELTGGNPFYVQEICRALGTASVEPTAANVPRIRDLSTETIARAVLVRVGSASADGPALARSLAVLGDPAELRLTAKLAGLEVEAATASAVALTDADVLADERPLRFVHPIVSAAVAGDLTAAERAAAHGDAARLLAAEGAPAEQVASHLLSAEPLGDAWATDQLRAAALVAVDRGSPAIAARYLSRALEEPAGASASEVLRELGVAELSAGNGDAALRHLERAAAGVVESHGRAAVARDLARAALATGDIDRAVEVLRAARDELGAEDPDLALAISAELSGVALLTPAAAATAMEPLLRFADVPGATPAERVLLANLAHWLGATGASAERCADLATRALADGRLLEETRAESAPFHHAVFVLIAADRLDDAQSNLDDALADARRRGSIVAFATTSAMRSLVAYRSGRLAEAEAEARGAIEAALHEGWPALSIGVAFLIDALIERGRLDEAERALDDGGFAEEIGEGLALAPVLAARGRLRIALGDVTAGVADLLEWGRRSARGDSLGTAGTPTFRTYAAPALSALGEHAQASALIAEELELARNWGAARALGMALGAAGIVEGGDRGLALLEEASATLAPTQARLEHARTLIELGAALRRSGQASNARAPLREGMDLAHRCGAAPLVVRAQDELAASGVRRRPRTLLKGVEALTPRERRIAAIAASGRTNREIAQALFISRKTVEMHLRNAYRKLEIESRASLPAALAKEDVAREER